MGRLLAIGAALVAAVLIVLLLGQDGPGYGRKDVVGGGPLHYAVVDGDLEEVKRLINQDADVNAREDDGWSPLHGSIHRI